MATAGQPRAYASVIQHQARTSGSTYDTPIVPFATSDGFVIPLPYGARADWVENVKAQGCAVIVNEGATCRVDRPEVVVSDLATADIPPRNQWSLRLSSVDQVLRLRTVIG
jgi:hypothetical protein